MDESGAGAWAFTFRALDGSELPLRHFRGAALLVVNTASRCGFTPQYKGLQDLWRDYRGRGLVVLGVPSNDFGGQEPGSAGEIRNFCETRFAVDFPLAEKARVRGSDAHPFYQWAARQRGPWASPLWNFHKYLVAPDGRLADWFSTLTRPDSPRLHDAIERILPAGISRARP